MTSCVSAVLYVPKIADSAGRAKRPDSEESTVSPGQQPGRGHLLLSNTPTPQRPRPARVPFPSGTSHKGAVFRWVLLCGFS
jgi:hypothetical protein